MKEEILIKYLKNNCSDKEFDEIVRWLKTNPQKKETRIWGLNQWKSFKPDLKNKDEKKYQALLYKIHYEINLKRRNDKDRKIKVLPRVTAWLSRAAAILFIPLLGLVFYMLSDNNFQMKKYTDKVVDSLEIIAPAGSRTVVQLLDGTKVHLNCGSKLKYPKSFNGDTRELTLSGEGFFNVAHDPKHPFIVKTKRLNIKVLGTKFNVLADSENDMVETTLIEGKVVLEQSAGNGKTKNIGSLVPGQHVDYNVVTGAISSTKGNMEKYIAWKDGVLVFDNSGINEVAERLERMFNVEIKVANEIKDYTYTVKFVDESLTQILNLLTKATPIDYKLTPREKLPDGTFSKERILFKKRQN